MKKVIRIVIIGFILSLVIAGIKYKSESLRTHKMMERIASNEFQYILDREEIGAKANCFYRFPTTTTSDMDGRVFSWYYILDEGDTAILNIEVKNRGKFLHEETFRVTMNKKWGYVIGPKGSFIEALPLRYEDDIQYLEKAFLADTLDNYLSAIEGLTMIIKSDKLFSFLQDGFFSVLEKNETYTVVAFDEEIANLSSENESKWILTAKVYFDDDYQVLILPYEAPSELWDNYNKY